MNRRAFIESLAGAAAAWPFAAEAQQSNMAIVGLLGSADPQSFSAWAEAFRQGLGETGYVEGQNLAIEYRWAEGKYDRLPALAAELVQKPVNVIFATGGSGPALAAKAATGKIPIVFETGGDPVKAGIVDSLGRPGGNITGVTFIAASLVPKLVELLHQLVPNATKIGALVNPNYAEAAFQRREAESAAARIGRSIRIVDAGTPADMDAAFATLAREGTEAMLVANDPYYFSIRDQIIELAARYRIPTIYFLRDFVTAGGLMSYGASIVEAFRQAGVYVGRVLKGERPADLPVIQSTRTELVVNVKTAKTLGLKIPPEIMVGADEVIE